MKPQEPRRCLRGEVGGMNMKRRWPWDVDIDTSRASLEHLGRALIETESTLTDSMIVGRQELGHRVTALLRVHVSVEKRERFEEIIGSQLRPPPRASVGFAPPVDDGHPGRVVTHGFEHDADDWWAEHNDEKEKT